MCLRIIKTLIKDYSLCITPWINKIVLNKSLLLRLYSLSTPSTILSIANNIRSMCSLSCQSPSSTVVTWKKKWASNLLVWQYLAKQGKYETAYNIVKLQCSMLWLEFKSRSVSTPTQAVFIFGARPCAIFISLPCFEFMKNAISWTSPELISLYRISKNDKTLRLLTDGT